MLFDWTDGAPRPRIRDPKMYAERAQAALHALATMPADKLQRLQHGVAQAAPRLIYRLAGAAAETAVEAAAEAESDAVDVLVERMRALRRVADGEELLAYQRDLATRRELIEAQRLYEDKRRVT